MICPAAQLADPDRDAIAATCSYCRRCLTLAVQLAPDGTIHELRLPLDGGREIMLVYEPDGEPWLVELSAAEAAEVFDGAA
jgi:hypothetical protein